MRPITLLLAGAIPFLPSRASAAPQSGPPIEVLEYGSSEGAFPYSGVIQASDGLLYGTTQSGGAYGGGTIFELGTDGSNQATIFDFDPASDGSAANGLLEGSDGALYGTTRYGGAANSGTIYKIQRDGTGFTVLHHCDASSGYWPRSRLIQAADGFLYGTAGSGGTKGYGVVFQISTDGSSYSVIYEFDGVVGMQPYGLIQASNGTFYGECSYGGANNEGSVFFLYSYTFGRAVIWFGGSLLSFDASSTGDGGYTNLIEGGDGALFGMTSSSGTNPGGTLFKIQKDGSGLTVLRAFDASTGDGPYDGSALLEGSDGAIYGTTRGGGAFGFGTIFRCEKDGGDFEVVCSFDYYGDSGNVACGLIQGSDGRFYGTTRWGDASSPAIEGAVYRVNYRAASWENYGSGLAGDLGIPGFVANGDPGIGGSVSLTVTNSKKSNTGATLFMGTSRASIPLRGGTLLVGNVFFLFTTVITGPQLSITGSLPDDPALAGLVLDLQWLEGDPAAPRGLSFTPGLELVLGW